MVDMNSKIPGTENFLWKEVFASTTANRLGIDNYPPAGDQARIIHNLVDVMRFVQEARNYFDVPIRVNSGYRCPALNKAVGGSTTSFHAHGQAVDLSFPAGSEFGLEDLFCYFVDGYYTELIAEDISPTGGWIHFAMDINRKSGRQLKYKLVGKPVVRADKATILKEVFG